MFLYDVANLLPILIVVFISFRFGYIPMWLSFFLGMLALTPFFLNYVLFEPSYMPDQWTYYSSVQNIRHFSPDPRSTSVEAASWMLSFIPLPYVETIQSLGFFNRFIITLLTIWLYASKKLRGWPLLFLLFYPSLLLYSSLSLRDSLVMLFMFLSVFLFIDNKKLLALAISLPLFLIKFQNFFLVIVFFLAHLYFSRDSIVYRFRHLFLIILVSAIAPFLLTIIEIIDINRLNFFVDDGGYKGSYVHIRTVEDFIIIALQSAPYFLMKPLPWEADSFLQLVQSFENILILIFLCYMFLKSSSVDKNIAFKWFVYLIAAFSIYGLVVYNFGSAARYKFPFIALVVVGMAYELYLKHGKLILNKVTKD